MLKISGLKAKTEDNLILKGVDLTIKKGEIHALMGKNGSGKSTLAQVLMGNPLYEVEKGIAKFNNKNLFKLAPDERALSGLFLSFQYPSEVTGVGVFSYLRMIYNKSHQKQLSPVRFREFLAEKMKILSMNEEITKRYLNEGFSGGEKKRMEMLQMLVLEPKMAILDEVDSGLDVDALKIVGKAVNYLNKNNDTAVLLITHYARILKYIKPSKVHVMEDGMIVKSGGYKLAHDIEESGYSMLLMGL